MRTHGISDDSGHMHNDDTVSYSEDHNYKPEANVPPSNKHMYALRMNPYRLKSGRMCENCGKEFLSWKSFLKHGKCNSEDAELLVSSPRSDNEDDLAARRECGWSKRKRSSRAVVGNTFNSVCPTREEEDLANCLMMLSNATDNPLGTERQESCTSSGKEDGKRHIMMNLMAPISCKFEMEKANVIAHNGKFECKACKKVFNSHQALGGHRASHKKVKGCFAARPDHDMDDDQDHDVITHEEFPSAKSNSTMQFDAGHSSRRLVKRKPKVHECSICHRMFSSGQALGGHKRCHWITSNSPDTSSFAKTHQFQQQIQLRPKLIDNSEPLNLKLGLNLPAVAINPTGFDASRDNFLQPWIATRTVVEQQPQQTDQNDNIKIKNNYRSSGHNIAEDEDNSGVKLVKSSELKNLNMSGSSSPWLQVGIGSSTSHVVVDP